MVRVVLTLKIKACIDIHTQTLSQRAAQLVLYSAKFICSMHTRDDLPQFTSHGVARQFVPGLNVSPSTAGSR